MTREETLIDKRATELRMAFDQSFAQASAGVSASTEAFLAIGVGGDNYALRLSEISGLYTNKKVLALPSDVPELLGVASFRGALIPVYDLRVLLGYPVNLRPRWLVQVAAATPIGLAFDRFDGHLHLPRDAIGKEEKAQEREQHLTESLRTNGEVRPIVSVASMIESIKKRVQQDITHKER